MCPIVYDESMPNVTIYLPSEVFEQWKKDKKHKGVIAKLIAEHYGFVVNVSRVVVNTPAAKMSSPLPHLAAPLLQKFKAKDEV